MSAPEIPAAPVKPEGFPAGALQGACSVRQPVDGTNHLERGKPGRQETVRWSPVQLQQAGPAGGEHDGPVDRQDQAEVVAVNWCGELPLKFFNDPFVVLLWNGQPSRSYVNKLDDQLASVIFVT